MDMEKGVALVVVSVWARDLASVLALAMAMAMELVVVSEEGRQVGAREVDPIASRR